MKKKINILILLSSLLFSSTKSFATHAASGELVYELINSTTNQYKFTYKFYRDCASGALAPTSVTMCYSNSCGVNGSLALTNFGTLPNGNPNGSVVSTGCPNLVTNCNGGSSEGFQEWWYSGNFILPSTCNTWKFSVNINGRDIGILNLLNPGSASLYVETQFNNTISQINSSPTTFNPSVLYSCLNLPFLYNPGISDVNSDSLVFESISSMTSSGVCTSSPSNIAYSSGSSTPSDPFPTGSTFSVHPSTGLISFTPAQTGQFVITIKVSEYRSGQLIGSFTRDMIIIVENCNTTAPSITIDTTTILGGQLLDGDIYGCMTANFEFCFSIKSPHPGAQLIATDNHSIIAPSSTIIYNNLGLDSIRGCLFWALNPSDTGLHILSVTVTDTTCTPPGLLPSSIFNIPIKVINTAPTATNNSRCGPGIVNLSASSLGNIFWFDVPSGGTPINTGAAYSPNVNTTTTFYVESNLSSTGSISTVGPPNKLIGGGGGLYSSLNQYTIFNVLNPCTLHSVIVYPNSAGNVTLQLRNSTGSSILNSTTITVTAAQIGTPVTMVLDWALSIGNNYRLYRGASTVLLWRSSNPGIIYPYTNYSISITGNSLGISNYYYWAYNWEISNSLNSTCISPRVPVTATVTPLTTGTISPSTTVCQNAPSPEITFTGSGGSGAPYTFIYKINNGPNQSVISPGNSVNISVPTNNAGTLVYKLVGVNTANCSNSQSDSVTIVINPVVSATASNINACIGASVTLTGTPSGGTFNIPNPYTGPSTSYTYTYTNPNGCISVSAPATITVNPLPIVTASNVNGCIGNPVTLNGLPSGGTYSLPNPYSGLATSYTYTYSSGGIGCLVTSSPGTITFRPKPTASIGANATVCQFSTSPIITFTGVGGTPPYTFQYKINNGSTFNVSTSAISSSVSINASTFNVGTFNYKLVNVSDIYCSQTQSDSSVIVVNPFPSVTASTIHSCVGSTVNLIGSPSGGTFNKPNPYTGPTTTYNYTFTNSFGCTATSSNASIIMHPFPTATVSGGGLACSGFPLPNVNIALTGTPPWNIVYSNGFVNTTINNILNSPYVITGANVGNYSVVSINDLYCNGTSSGSALVSIIAGGGSTQVIDLGVSAIVAPISNCGLSNNETVTVKVNNYGNSCQSNFQISYKADAGSIVTETVNASIVPGSFINYSFVTKANMSAYGAHTIKAYTSLSSDTIKSNDTLATTIQHFLPLVAPGNLLPNNDTTGLDYPIGFSWSYVLNATHYDLYIWKFVDTMPSTPTVSNITQINYAYATQNLEYGTKYKWKVVSKANTCAVSSAIQTFTMRKLPDLQIQQIIVPATGVSEATIAVSWKTRNNGPGKTNTTWYETVYLSESAVLGVANNYYLGAFNNLSALDSGFFYQSPIHTFTLPQGIQGPYYIIVKTDAYNAVKEISEINNLTTSDTIQISIAPNPDLQITNLVVAPTTVFSNDSLTITWKVKNLGSGPTSTPNWYDYIFMDTNAIFNINNTLFMGSHYHTGSMAVIDSYSVTKKVKIPIQTEGQRYIHIFTDRFNQLFEYSSENNNTATSIPIQVILAPAADLKVTQIQMFNDTLSNGQTFTTQWSTKNEGAVMATPAWQDLLFFSSDSTLTGSTYNLGSIILDSLNSLATRVNQVSSTVAQTTTQGIYYLYVKTDNTNNIFEGNFENNNFRRRTLPVYIANADLDPLTFTVPISTSSESSINVAWATKNIGKGSILNNSWKDGVYLSLDTVLAATDIFLNTVTNSNLLLPNGQYNRNLNVTIPAGVQGNYYLILKSDYQSSIVEANENNNLIYAPIIITLAPWPDLQVNSFIVPTSDTAGTPISFNASIKNFGLGKISSKSWTDRVYLSTSNNFNAPGKQLLWSAQLNLSLDTGQTYTQNSSFNLPANLIAGQYYLHYVIDALDSIFENTGSNNNMQVSSSISILSQNIDLAAFTAQADTNLLTSGQSLVVHWTGKNLGIDDALTAWTDAIYLSTNTTLDSNDVLVGSWQIDPPLKKDSLYSRTKTITIPNSANGNYYLILLIDKNHQLNDSLLANNKYVLQNGIGGTLFNITLPPPSDLVPSVFNCPAQSAESQPITISYTINNNGVGATLGSSWVDNVYMSTDNILNSTDVFLGSFLHNNALNASAQYNESKQVVIPSGLSGNYFLILKTDADNLIYEHQNELNNTSFASIFITPQQPSDLIARNISTPVDSFITGANITLNWHVVNQGQNIASGFFRDGIYISKDSVWDVNDPLLALKDGYVNILPADSISRQLITPLDNVATGDYYLIIKTDLLNNIVESNETNNTGIANSKINVDVKELIMFALKYDTIVNNRQLYYKINIPSTLQTETMKLTLKGDSAHHAINKLFLSHETTPTANVFEFKSDIPFEANQEIVVPQLLTGTYYIMALGNDTATINQKISLLAQIIPFSVTSVNSNQGGNTGGVTIQINGAKFANNTQFGLLDSANNFIAPYSHYPVNETKAFAGFNLQNVALGFYDVIAINSTGDTVRLVDGFQVISGPGSSGGNAGGGTGGGTGFVCQIVNIGFDDLLQTDAFYPESTRPNRVLSMTIAYENKGSIDIPIPIRYLISLEGAPIGFTPESVNGNTTDLTLEFKEIGGPPEVLRSGASGFIKIYTKASAPLEFVIAE